MSLVNLALWGLGIVLIAVGYSRAKGPYQRYQALKAQDANIARYERWRGGVRDPSPTGASVAMQVLLRQARLGGAIVIAGFLCVLAGFAVR